MTEPTEVTYHDAAEQLSDEQGGDRTIPLLFVSILEAQNRAAHETTNRLIAGIEHSRELLALDFITFYEAIKKIPYMQRSAYLHALLVDYGPVIRLARDYTKPGEIT